MIRSTTEQLQLSGLMSFNKAHYNRIHNPAKTSVITADTRLVCPKHYTKETKKAWKAIVPNLITLGSLTEQDLPLMKQLFDSHDDYVLAREQYLKFKETVDLTDPKSVDMEFKLFRHMDMARDRFNKIACRYGLTPTERSRLPINKPEVEQVDPLELALQG